MQQVAFEGAKQNEILRTTRETIYNNKNNLIQQLFYSPVRLFPAIGVMSGAHYQTLSMFFMLESETY